MPVMLTGMKKELHSAVKFNLQNSCFLFYSSLYQVPNQTWATIYPFEQKVWKVHWDFHCISWPFYELWI